MYNKQETFFLCALYFWCKWSVNIRIIIIGQSRLGRSRYGTNRHLLSSSWYSRSKHMFRICSVAISLVTSQSLQLLTTCYYAVLRELKKKWTASTPSHRSASLHDLPLLVKTETFRYALVMRTNTSKNEE